MDSETKLIQQIMHLLCDHMSDAIPTHEDKFWPAWNSLLMDAELAGHHIEIPEELLRAGLGQIYSHDLIHSVDQDY